MTTTQAELNGMFARLCGAAARNGADVSSWSFHKGSKTYGNSYSIQSDSGATNFGSNSYKLGMTAGDAYERMNAMCVALESVEYWQGQS